MPKVTKAGNGLRVQATREVKSAHLVTGSSSEREEIRVAAIGDLIIVSGRESISNTEWASILRGQLEIVDHVGRIEYSLPQKAGEGGYAIQVTPAAYDIDLLERVEALVTTVGPGVLLISQTLSERSELANRQAVALARYFDSSG